MCSKSCLLTNSDWLKLNTTIYPYNMIVALIRLNKPKKNSLWNCGFFFYFSRLASLERIYMDTNIIKDNLLQAPRWPSGHVSQLMNAFTHGTIKTCATTWCVSDQILHSTHLYLSNTWSPGRMCLSMIDMYIAVHIYVFCCFN